VTEEIPEYRLHSEPEEFDWFFDIYIQGSNTTFLELSLKQEFQLSYFPWTKVHEDQIDQATKST
jgi:hypothetical protein